MNIYNRSINDDNEDNIDNKNINNNNNNNNNNNDNNKSYDRESVVNNCRNCLVISKIFNFISDVHET